jgi:membrane-associated phospholipid phosphatase
VHYPSDILCGALLGLLCGGIVLLAFRCFARRRPPQPTQEQINK